MGPKRLHGPHQSAQKSTSTMSLPLMVSSKLLALMSTVAMFAPCSGTAADLLRRLAQPDLRSDYSLLTATPAGPRCGGRASQTLFAQRLFPPQPHPGGLT